MKTIALVLALCVSGTLADVTTDQIIILLRYKDECMTETGIDKELLDKALKAESTGHGEEKLGCFVACILKKVGIMNKDGSIDAAAAKEHAPMNVPNDIAVDMIKKCKDPEGADDCAKAANFVNCLIERQLANAKNTTSVF